MLDRLTGMEVFACVVDSGSFVAAASRLEMSPQMVARHVAALEQRVGASLLQRTTRRQHLTALGEAYLEHCRAVLREAAAADAMLEAGRHEPQGWLRINAPVTFGRFALVPLVGELLRRHPRWQCELNLSDSLVVPGQSSDEVILRIGDLDPALPWVARPLRPYRLLICASPAYLQAMGRPRRPEQLGTHECLGFQPWPAQSRQQWILHKQGRQCEVRVDSRLRLNDWDAMLRAALDGLGVLVGYEMALAPWLAQKRLLPLLPDWELAPRPMHVLHPPGRQTSPRLACFMNALLQRYGLD